MEKDDRAMAAQPSRVMVSNFDAGQARQSLLGELGLPPRPDRKRAPALYAHWSRFLRHPVTVIEPGVGRGGPALTFLQHGCQRTVAGGDPVQSANWSGAIVDTTNAATFAGDGFPGLDPGVFGAVAGTWVVPNSYPPAATWVDQSWADGAWTSAVWIGMDGAYPPPYEGIRVGTVQGVRALGGRLYWGSYAFAEWYGLDTDSSEQVLSGLQILPGDLITASIICDPISDPSSVSVMLRKTGTTYMPSTVVAVQLAAPAINVVVNGTSAEWIVERPTNAATGTPLDFPDYGTTWFYNTLALYNSGLAWQDLGYIYGWPHMGGAPVQSGVNAAATIEMMDQTAPDKFSDTVVSTSHVAGLNVLGVAYTADGADDIPMPGPYSPSAPPED